MKHYIRLPVCILGLSLKLILDEKKSVALFGSFCVRFVANAVKAYFLLDHPVNPKQLQIRHRSHFNSRDDNCEIPHMKFF